MNASILILDILRQNIETVLRRNSTKHKQQPHRLVRRTQGQFGPDIKHEDARNTTLQIQLCPGHQQDTSTFEQTTLIQETEIIFVTPPLEQTMQIQETQDISFTMLKQKILINCIKQCIRNHKKIIIKMLRSPHQRDIHSW